MDLYRSLDNRIKFIDYKDHFNYSKINNFAIQHANGEHLILLNNDIEIITPSWIESLLEHSQQEQIGVVGGKLYYPNNTIQHAGVIIGIGGVAGHSHKNLNRTFSGYFNRASIVQNLSAVTAACFMVKKSIYQKVGGLNQKDLAVSFNDVDFCLRVMEEGYLNIFTPYCEAYHNESLSRGFDCENIEKSERAAKEVQYMFKRHCNFLKTGDPFYNPNLSLNFEDFRLKEGL